MALVDPYSQCPCGSDKKFKWCCHKAEPYVEKSNRLAENGQYDAALAALDEGLTKAADNPWLLLRKALLLIVQQKPEAATAAIQTVLRRQPDHLGAAVLQTRFALTDEGPVAAAAALQRALSNTRPESHPRLAKIVAMVAEELAKLHHHPAALKHFELARKLDSSENSAARSAQRSVKTDPLVSPWLKQPYSLAEAPQRLGGPQREQFDRALAWAEEGLWSSAAAAFDMLIADPVAGHAADRNLGLCRLWLGDHAAAAAALRRWIDRAGPTTEAVDLAVVCQMIDESTDKEPIEHVLLSWPLRDRVALLRALEGEPTIVKGEDRPLDPDDEDSPKVTCFYFLDRPSVEPVSGLSRQEIPQVQADILIGPETVMLETDDDGGLNGLIDRFTALVGKAVPPAHPRTKVVGQTDRSQRALSWHWYLPPGLPDDERKRLDREQTAYLTSEVWPVTPMTFFGGRTPLQVARSSTDAALLRGAVLALERSGNDWSELVDWTKFRARLNLPSEPEIEPETVDIGRVALGRLSMIPVDRLDDDRLLALYLRAHEWGLLDLRPRAAHEIIGRPSLKDSGKIEPIILYGDLALEAIGQGDRDGSMEWIRRGRQAEPADRRAVTAPHWDMFELQIRAQFDKPEEWVPELAMILDRYRENESATMILTARLLEMGLIRLASPADQPGELMLDTRMMQQLLALYGPKVTTSSGYLGVSATRGEIWTPGSEAKGSPIWTPGSGAGGGSEKPRIIVPG